MERITSLEDLKKAVETEKEEVRKVRKDLMQLLSHDTTPTRRQFASLLRHQADVVDASIPFKHRLLNVERI